ncbi:nicotinate-nucleotide adenylyltransferase [Salinisphaera sp. Q1T1-3]|uniref:nicotinate-nucleotide adenylyltransferase n=1 Tax=Salinisphaera sp. Q1T1-3 TaxID=2321229 RepID=UPI000E71E401|nr:nicotinate-nucleotide adenylyltransferase [Salinisphaera sp. Q1T1-3]RJS93624.1 nicotinate-nucleotide adenylyltransferase [Salinisphaera sp. Q1T1-3]
MSAKQAPTGAPGAPIGILGGTFDPVHNGHLRLAMELATELKLAQVRLIPNGRPPHREQPGATPGQRAKWIRVATADEPLLALDDRELLRRGHSYTVDTLASLRTDFPDRPLCLIMGRDVFAKLPSWHRWEALFEHAHIVLIERPGLHAELAPEARELLAERGVDDIRALHEHLAGAIYSYAPPPLAISASRIRALIATGASPRYLLPEVILEDIMDTDIYRAPAQSAE